MLWAKYLYNEKQATRIKQRDKETQQRIIKYFSLPRIEVGFFVSVVKDYFTTEILNMLT